MSKNANAKSREQGAAREDEDGPTSALARQADRLIALAAAAELFHTQDHVAYATIPIGEHRETWLIGRGSFERWLRQRYLESFNRAPGSEALRTAIGQLAAKAQFMGEKHDVFVRIARENDVVWLDLGDGARQVVRIDRSGWRIDPDPPVRFRRPAGLEPLPTPERGGSIEALKHLLNLANDADFVLVVCWMLHALGGRWPYPILAIIGEHGTAKSTLARLICRLLDPAAGELRSLPRKEDDLAITAANSHVRVFDNLSAISLAMSDALCRLATGGGHAKRMLYSDSDEVVLKIARPVILTGIGDYISQPDLGDRALLVKLNPIPAERRKAERTIEGEFEAMCGLILGVLLDGVSVGLRRLGDVELAVAPRMADFAEFATACETAFWTEGTFATAYDRNRRELVEETLACNDLACAVRTLLAVVGCWNGTATELMGKLRERSTVRSYGIARWPSSPSEFSKALRRLEPFLREVGVIIERDRANHGGDRLLHLSQAPAPGDAASFGEMPSAASAPSASMDATRSAGLAVGAGKSSDKSGSADAADAADGELQSFAKRWSAKL